MSFYPLVTTLSWSKVSVLSSSLFALGYLFINAGPNTTTFIIPVEIYPTRFRATAHGISAACGKVGAAVASFGFSYAVKSSIGVQGTLGILAGCMFIGAVATFFCTPETKGLSLTEDEEDDDATLRSPNDLESPESPELDEKHLIVSI